MRLPKLVVEENNLQVQVSALRKILGQEAIATIPGRGYRFTVTLTPSNAPLKTLLAPIDQNAPSIAVLPFVNMSDDAANEYFADGIAEELLNVLSKVRGLRVASHTSAFTFKGRCTRLRICSVGFHSDEGLIALFPGLEEPVGAENSVRHLKRPIFIRMDEAARRPASIPAPEARDRLSQGRGSSTTHFLIEAKPRTLEVLLFVTRLGPIANPRRENRLQACPLRWC